ncbi:thioredoxin family protein [Chromobacterium subtsugae]|uniref:Thioredoxin family protein n=1 Tax=Chromobacterium subtsugae TaxID=251747 RepID=A0ABS7FI89_9NEIS|nr:MULTISPECIES: thioredoxin family protein [Chromobacterium]KUM05365.1 thioredoxin [Chromobacterium subtsugae]KZE84693.1 thioredoxin [Chromobacterium sp. F49]MBW7567482.1 thioredoxin family protein [Chromobacterium subtsugae]MBW8289808.1 thioredoxin family protein [Chromobacterium subtsugae]OBU84913.1 thioredoxin [Chromobacterium subtsugae]
MGHYLVDNPAPEDVAALPGLTLLEFGVDWCPHCQGAQPLLAQFLSAHPGLRHLALEDGKGKRLGRVFRVKLWPSFILLRDGVELARAARPQDAAELEALLAP